MMHTSCGMIFDASDEVYFNCGFRVAAGEEPVLASIVFESWTDNPTYEFMELQICPLYILGQRQSKRFVCFQACWLWFFMAKYPKPVSVATRT